MSRALYTNVVNECQQSSENNAGHTEGAKQIMGNQINLFLKSDTGAENVIQI